MFVLEPLFRAVVGVTPGRGVQNDFFSFGDAECFTYARDILRGVVKERVVSRIARVDKYFFVFLSQPERGCHPLAVVRGGGEEAGDFLSFDPVTPVHALF